MKTLSSGSTSEHSHKERLSRRRALISWLVLAISGWIGIFALGYIIADQSSSLITALLGEDESISTPASQPLTEMAAPDAEDILSPEEIERLNGIQPAAGDLTTPQQRGGKGLWDSEQTDGQ